MDRTLSSGTMEKINKMVERVAGRAKRDANKSFDRDFAEEIRTYLKDGLMELMDEGRTEEEALKSTMEKFDVAELKENFNDFAKEFEWFGVDEYKDIKYSDIVMKKIMMRAMEKSAAVGLFYGAFIIFGMTIGAFLGFLLGHTLINTLIGFTVGLFIGIGLGLLSDALIALVMDLTKLKKRD
jgi:hypothetical protein